MFDAEPPRAGVDELRPLLDWGLERLEAQQAERAEAAHDTRKARVAQRAAQDGRQVTGKAVLGEIRERVAVGHTLKGEAAEEGHVREVLREELVGRDGDVAAREAERRRVERGGEDAAGRPAVRASLSARVCAAALGKLTHENLYPSGPLLSSGLGKPPQNETKDETCSASLCQSRTALNGVVLAHLVTRRARFFNQPHGRDVVDARVLRARSKVDTQVGQRRKGVKRTSPSSLRMTMPAFLALKVSVVSARVSRALDKGKTRTWHQAEPFEETCTRP